MSKLSAVWSKISSTLFSGWELKEKILRPVLVNLLTGLLLFLTAVIFRDPIYNYFAPRPQTRDWPIYCVVEPQPSGGGPVTADLFVMNLSARKYIGSDLDSLAKELSPGDGKKLSPLIEIAIKDNLEDEEISEVKPDAEFNKEKGSASLQQVDKQHWRVRLDEIKEGKILKFTIRTTADRPISSRASFETLPLKINYARTP
jgi:hypothetical protein